MDIENKKKHLISLIEIAFANLKLGDGMSLHQAKAIDDHKSDEEITNVRNLDPWQNWADIPHDVLEKCGSPLLAHAYYDPESLIFHLPAMMRLAVEKFPANDSYYNICISHLTREPQYMIQEYKLSTSQIKVIAEFWEFYFDESKINLGEHFEKRLLEWVEAAERSA